MTSLMPWRRNRTNAISRTDPFRGAGTEMDRLLDNVFGRWPTFVPATAWGVDVRETDDGFTVRLEAPGFEPGEFDIQVSGDQLQVSAEHVVKDGDTEVTERRLHRAFTLPGEVNPDEVEAAFINGILEIRLAKTEQAKWKKVPVKTA